MQPGPIHDSIKPISWILGKWVSDSGTGTYPTIEAFSYCEEIVFESCGQPTINYYARSWHTQKKHPMHFESGFLKINPGTNRAAFVVAHNFGLTSLEEGDFDESNLTLKSSNISRMEFAKEPSVTSLERHFILMKENIMKQHVSMQTSNTPITTHTSATYRRVIDDE